MAKSLQPPPTPPASDTSSERRGSDGREEKAPAAETAEVLMLQLVTPEAKEPSSEDEERLAEALSCVDTLRAKLVSGEVRAFVGVAIADDHSTYRYQASTKKTTHLELLGALMATIFGVREDD